MKNVKDRNYLLTFCILLIFGFGLVTLPITKRSWQQMDRPTWTWKRVARVPKLVLRTPVQSQQFICPSLSNGSDKETTQFVKQVFTFDSTKKVSSFSVRLVLQRINIRWGDAFAWKFVPDFNKLNKTLTNKHEKTILKGKIIAETLTVERLLLFLVMTSRCVCCVQNCVTWLYF